MSNHPQAGLAAQAAECAGQQGSYWAMHGQLFEHADEWASDTETALAAFARYAEAVGVNAAELTTCVSEERYAAEVQGDFNEAQMLGLTGTPAFIINGKLLSGARPTEQFIQVLDRELNPR